MEKWGGGGGGGGGKQSLIVVSLGFQNPPPLYTTHARSMHLPYEKSNCFPQNNLILSINPYQKATRPIWKPGMMFFLNPFLNEEFGNGFSLIPQPLSSWPIGGLNIPQNSLFCSVVQQRVFLTHPLYLPHCIKLVHSHGSKFVVQICLAYVFAIEDLDRVW